LASRRLEAKSYGLGLDLGLRTYDLGLEDPHLVLALGLESYTDIVYRKYLSKSNQNFVHYLSCYAARHTVHLIICSDSMVKATVLGL